MKFSLLSEPFNVTSEIQASDLTSFLLIKSESPLTTEGIINLLKVLIGNYSILSEEVERNLHKHIKEEIEDNEEEIFSKLEDKGFITRKDISEITEIKYDSMLDYIMMKLVESTGSLRGIQGKHFIDLIKRKEVKFEESLDQGVIISEGENESESNSEEMKQEANEILQFEQFSDDEDEIQLY